MNSKKVKEIKKALECCSNPICEDKCYYHSIGCMNELSKDSLTIINELESENEKLRKSDTSKEESSIEYYNLYKDFKRENQRLKDRIAELEKENEIKTDIVVNLLKKQEFYEKDKLKQFAERLREESFYIETMEDTYHVIDLSTVYAILREYINNDKS